MFGFWRNKKLREALESLEVRHKALSMAFCSLKDKLEQESRDHGEKIALLEEYLGVIYCAGTTKTRVTPSRYEKLEE